MSWLAQLWALLPLALGQLIQWHYLGAYGEHHLGAPFNTGSRHDANLVVTVILKKKRSATSADKGFTVTIRGFQ